MAGSRFAGGCRARMVAAAVLALLLAPSGRAVDDAVGDDPCGGAKVYVYRDLPQAFPEYEGHELLDIRPSHGRTEHATKEFGVPCAYDARDACHSIRFWGRGEAMDEGEVPQELRRAGLRFHRTFQNGMGWLFVGHVAAHCEAATPEEANLFYVPYPIVSVKRSVVFSMAQNASDADAHYVAVKEYLGAQPSWQRCNGCDHIVSIEAPIQNYRKSNLHKRGGYYNEDIFWENAVRLSHHAGTMRVRMDNRDREGSSWGTFPVLSVPWPLTFHPESDKQVERWLSYVFDPEHKRKPEAALIANTRPHRERIIALCEEPDTPCHSGDAIVPTAGFFSIYRDYTFSIQPGGDTPTRRGFFDTLNAGAIPVVFAPKARVANRADLKKSPESRHYRQTYLRYFGELTGWGDDWLDKIAIVAEDEEDAMRLIRETTPERIAELQGNIRSILPTLLFWDPTAAENVAKKPSMYRGQSVVATSLKLILRAVQAKEVGGSG